MTENQFYPTFKVLAAPSCKTEDIIKLKAKTYYNALKEFTWQVFQDVVDYECDNDDHITKGLRSPKYYRNKCINKQTRNYQNQQEIYNPSPEQRKKDVAAMFEFWETCIKYANTIGIKHSDKDGGFAHVSYPIGTFAKREYDKMST